MSIDNVVREVEANMTKVIQALKQSVLRVRTGRANLAMLDSVKVNYYGSKVPINQVAAISIPDARLITIKPWEKKMLEAITKAINMAEIDLTPQNDGDLIRIPIPSLTGDRRKELVRIVRRIAEDTRVQVRSNRREGNEILKQMEKDSEISEDDKKRGLDRIQKKTNEFIKEVDNILEDKEKEIMEL